MIANIINLDPIITQNIELISSIFGIIAFILYIFEKIKILNYLKTRFPINPIKFIFLWWYKYQAYKNGGDIEKVKHFFKSIYSYKLYSKNRIKQKTAIETIAQLNDIQWAFSTFVERVGNKPKLSPDNKNLILREIIKLCKKM